MERTRTNKTCRTFIRRSPCRPRPLRTNLHQTLNAYSISAGAMRLSHQTAPRRVGSDSPVAGHGRSTDERCQFTITQPPDLPASVCLDTIDLRGEIAISEGPTGQSDSTIESHGDSFFAVRSDDDRAPSRDRLAEELLRTPIDTAFRNDVVFHAN